MLATTNPAKSRVFLVCRKGEVVCDSGYLQFASPVPATPTYRPQGIPRDGTRGSPALSLCRIGCQPPDRISRVHDSIRPLPRRWWLAAALRAATAATSQQGAHCVRAVRRMLPRMSRSIPLHLGEVDAVDTASKFTTPAIANDAHESGIGMSTPIIRPAPEHERAGKSANPTWCTNPP